MMMESHDDIRRKIPQIWNKNDLTVVQPIRQMDPEYSEELIHTVCGKLEVNCFSVGEDEIEARALFPTAYLFQHDCTPNTTHVDSLGFDLTIRASKDIQPKDPITLTYTSSLYGTLRRRREIKQSKFFDCICNRCSSSTELGTYISAVKCYQCNEGWLLPHLPLENKSQWTCSTCKQFVDYSRPLIITEKSSADFEALKDASISDYENLMMKYVDSLHPHHSTMIRIKLTLSQMYGKTKGCLLGQMSPELLQRKYDICKDLFSVLNIIEPGMTRLRGITMYESHAPLLMLTQYSAANGLINQKELKKDLTKVKDLLTKSVAILAFEEPQTSQGLLYQVAKDALAQTKNWPV